MTPELNPNNLVLEPGRLTPVRDLALSGAPVIVATERRKIGLDDISDLLGGPEDPAMALADEPEPTYLLPYERIEFHPPSFEPRDVPPPVSGHQPVTLRSEDASLNDLPAVLNQVFAFRDTASAAMLTAIPPKIGDQQTVLTHLQLRVVGADVLQVLRDMPPAGAPGLARPEDPVDVIEDLDDQFTKAESCINSLHNRMGEILERIDLLNLEGRRLAVALRDPSTNEAREVLQEVSVPHERIDEIAAELSGLFDEKIALRDEIATAATKRASISNGLHVVPVDWTEEASVEPVVVERSLSKELDSPVLPPLPDAEASLQRVEDAIRELLQKGFLEDIPRPKALDGLDRTLVKERLPEAWEGEFFGHSPMTAYRLTPAGITAGSLIRAHNEAPVVSFNKSDNQVVHLPGALLLIADAGAVAKAGIYNAYAESGMMKPGDLGRAYVQEALNLRESLKIPGNTNPEVSGAKLIDCLEGATNGALDAAMNELPQVQDEAMPVSVAHLQDLTALARDIVALEPGLAADPFVRERITLAAATADAARHIAQARKIVAQEGTQALGRPEAWKLPEGCLEVDTRPIAAMPEAEARFKECSVRPSLASLPLVWPDAQREFTSEVVMEWIQTVVQSPKHQERALDAWLRTPR